MTIVEQMAAKGNVNDYTGGEVEVWYLLGAKTEEWVARINLWAKAEPTPTVVEIVSTIVTAFAELPLDHDANVVAPDPLYFT